MPYLSTMKHRDALWIFQLRNVKVSKMTMKTKKTLQHIAAVAVVLLTLCLVFVMPVGAEDTYATMCKNDNGCDGTGGASAHNGQSCDHVARIGSTYYNSVNAALLAVTTDEQIIEIIGDVEQTFTTGPNDTIIQDFELQQLNSTVKSVTFKGVSGTVNIGPTIGYHANARENVYGTVIFDNLTFKNCGINIGKTDLITFDKLQITNCKFEDSEGYLDAIFVGSPIEYDEVLIQKNTISGYTLGIRTHSTYDSPSSHVSIEENTFKTNGNCVQLTHHVQYTIAGNTLESKERPLHFMNFNATRGSTFTGNTVKFPPIYNDHGTNVPTQAIYHVNHPVVIGDDNRFIYTDGTEVTAYSSLMKHLYLDKTDAAIYVDSVKDDSGYYGGYVSVGFAKGTGNPTADVAALDIKSGYSLTKLHQNEDDGIGCHYIIGIGAASNSDMKLTAGTFAVDPTAYLADGYHVKAARARPSTPLSISLAAPCPSPSWPPPWVR